MNSAERTFAGVYREGDIIRFNTNSKAFGVQAGEYARVEGVNCAANVLTVAFTRESKAGGGRRMNYDPKRLQGVSVYEEAEIKVAEGERVQFRAPARKQRVSNGELGTVERIEKDKWTIKLDTNRRVFVSLYENPHLDYGYAVTSHSTQGQTVNRVLVNMNTRESDVLLNQRMAYVATSRMRSDVRIYTDSTGKLSAALARQVDKSIALEAVKRLPHEHSPNKEHSPDKEQTHEQRTTPSITGATRTGESREVATAAERDAPTAGRIATVERNAATERSATIESEATIVRHLSNAFDRERIYRIAVKRAVRDDGATSAVERGIEGRVGEESKWTRDGEREPRGANQRVASRLDADERRGGAARSEPTAVESGYKRIGSHHRGRSNEAQETSKPSHASERVAGESDRIATTAETDTRRLVDSGRNVARDGNESEVAKDRKGRDVQAVHHFAAVQSARENVGRTAEEAGKGLPHRAGEAEARVTSGKDDAQDKDGRYDYRMSDSGRVSYVGSGLRGVLVSDSNINVDKQSSGHLFSRPRNGSVPTTNSVLPVEVGRRLGVEHIDGDISDRSVNARHDNSQRYLPARERAGGLARPGLTTQASGATEPPRLADEIRALFERDRQIELMADEFVRIANEHRVAQGRAEISEQVQDAMREMLTKAAERVPSPAQVERDGQIAQLLNHEEPQHENALQSSLYAARYAANRHELIEQFTAKIEAAYEPQHKPERAVERHRERDDFTLSR